MVTSEQKEDSTVQALDQLPEVEDVCPPRPWNEARVLEGGLVSASVSDSLLS